MPRILGINRTSDAAICLMENGEVKVAIAKERLTRNKHDWGKLGDIPMYISHLPELQEPIDMVVECYSSDEERNNLDAYHQELREHLNLVPHAPIVEIPHHLSHTYSGFFPSGFDDAAVLVMDYQGSYRPLISYEQNDGDSHDLEVMSYYACKGETVTCVNKQYWNKGQQKLAGLGTFYTRFTTCVFPGMGREGIMMGLAAFGNAENVDLPELTVNNGHVQIPKEWTDQFDRMKAGNFFKNGEGTFMEVADYAAAGQHAYEQALLKCCEWIKSHIDSENLIIVGGCGLNCAANGFIQRNALFSNVFIPPAPHDAGTALGCAVYGTVHLEKESNSVFKWETDYLGPAYDIESWVAQVKNMPELSVERPENITQLLAEEIANGKIIGLFQQHSEFGPRALGNRSIIADPRFAFTQHFINSSIKHRQWFRPLSPIALEEAADEYFQMEALTPFMTFAVNVRSDKAQAIPAVTHVDGTARLQTVSPQQNEFIYELITAFKKITGIPVILNTSFNGQDEPIVEKPAEALSAFLKMPLNALVVPPYIIYKQNQAAKSAYHN